MASDCGCEAGIKIGFVFIGVFIGVAVTLVIGGLTKFIYRKRKGDDIKPTVDGKEGRRLSRNPPSKSEIDKPKPKPGDSIELSIVEGNTFKSLNMGMFVTKDDENIYASIDPDQLQSLIAIAPPLPSREAKAEEKEEYLDNLKKTVKENKVEFTAAQWNDLCQLFMKRMNVKEQHQANVDWMPLDETGGEFKNINQHLNGGDKANHNLIKNADLQNVHSGDNKALDTYMEPQQVIHKNDQIDEDQHKLLTAATTTSASIDIYTADG